jgi:hypothetical protein
MGDVVTALGRAVQESGHTVEVILPKYDSVDYKQVRPCFKAFVLLCIVLSVYGLLVHVLTVLWVHH